MHSLKVMKESLDLLNNVFLLYAYIYEAKNRELWKYLLSFGIPGKWSAVCYKTFVAKVVWKPKK